MSSLDSIRATWLGTAGVYISDGRTSFFIDPYVTRVPVLDVLTGKKIRPDVRKIEECIRQVSGQNASMVIVSHSHFDHLLDASEFAKKTGAMLVGSRSTSNVARSASIPEEKIRIIEEGDPFDTGAFSIRFIKGLHSSAFFGRIPFPGVIREPFDQPARASDYRLGVFSGIFISHPHGTFIHHASAGWIPGMYDGVEADTVFLCISGRKNTVSYIEEVIVRTRARKVIPIHHDWYFSPIGAKPRLLPGVDIDGFIRALMQVSPGTETRFVSMLKEFRVPWL